MADSQNKYLVVEFPEEQDAEGRIAMAVISTTWIFEQDENMYSYWPSYLKSEVQKDKIILQHQPIDKDKCTICPINIKYSTDDYNNARSKLQHLEEESQTESEAETRLISQIKRTQKKKIFTDFTDNFSDSEIEIPKVPAPKKTYIVLSNYNSNSQSRNSEESTIINKTIKQKRYSQFSEVTGKKSSEVDDVSSGSSMASKNSSCSGCEENRALILQLLCKLEVVKEDIRYLIKMNRKMIDSPETNLKFNQIDNFEELHNFNNELSDQEKFAEACNKLQVIGGKDIPDTVRKILSTILTNNIAIKMNWTGRNEKNGFKDLINIVKLVHVSTRKNPLSQMATLNMNSCR